jgi:hypothetical protein
MNIALHRRHLLPLSLSLVALALVIVLSSAYLIWRDRTAGAALQPLANGQVPQALRLTVYESGIAAVSAGQLRQAGLLAADFAPSSLRLSRDGRPVPFHIDPNNGEATLYFYAEAITNTLEAPAVYWLANGVGQAMSEQDGQPTTVPDTPAGAAAGTTAAATTGWRQQRWQENTTFLAQSEGEDVWLGQFLFAPSSLDIALDGIAPAYGPAELSVRFWSNNQAPVNPDHHVQLWLNGRELLSHTWDGIKEETIHLSLAAGVLQADGNILTIVVPGDTGAAGEAIYLDWVHLAYEGHLQVEKQRQLQFQSQASTVAIGSESSRLLVFDVTRPGAPAVVTGVQPLNNGVHFSAGGETAVYVALEPAAALQPTISLAPQWPMPLTAADRGADYIVIIAPAPGFDEALRPLLEHRLAEGLRVTAVPLEQVYDEFGHGRQTATAIRDFLAYTRLHWPAPAPRFVLLAGNASYDLYNFTGGKNQNLLPTYLVYTEYAGYVASDTWFTMFDKHSLTPHMAIGRLPAANKGELTIMVDKILAYEKSALADWHQRALLVADNEIAFDLASDELASDLLATGYETQKLYMTENPDIRDSILRGINDGVAILNYVGHGSLEVWGSSRVFQAQDAGQLTNGLRLPIFTTFTCLNGYFNHPQVDSLAESLLLAKNGGIVAAVAPSGRSLTQQQMPLANTFYQVLLSGEATTLGQALLMAKVATAGDPFYTDVIHTFNLLGDPALNFRRPSPPS